jgi:hypothetical protein
MPRLLVQLDGGELFHEEGGCAIAVVVVVV